jgi:hypothetical protein
MGCVGSIHDARRFLVVALGLMKSCVLTEKRTGIGLRQLSRNPFNEIEKKKTRRSSKVSNRVEQIYRA